MIKQLVLCLMNSQYKIFKYHKILLLKDISFQMQNSYGTMMPQIIKTIQTFTQYNHTYAIESFELLDELCENANSVITPHVKSLVNLCLTIVDNKLIEPEIKKKAINFIGWLAKIKKKALVKHNLIAPIVSK